MSESITRSREDGLGRLVSDGGLGWVVHGHHPDWRRLPELQLGRVAHDHVRTRLVWNVFRTLALVDPSRWLRQLHARVFGFDERYRAPGWLDVRLWPLADPPGTAGSGAAAGVDVLLESEHVVWVFRTAFQRDVIAGARDVLGPDPILRTIAAGAELAGHRRCFVGLLSSGERTAPIGARLVRRYAATPALLRSRLPGGLAKPDDVGVGMSDWKTLAAVMADCARSPAIGEPERLALRRCLRWLSTEEILE